MDDFHKMTCFFVCIFLFFLINMLVFLLKPYFCESNSYFSDLQIQAV